MNRFSQNFLWMLTLWRCHSRSQIKTFLIKNSLFLLFMLLIDWRNKCRWILWKNKVWFIQKRHLPCFNLRSLGKLLSLFCRKYYIIIYCTNPWKRPHSSMAKSLIIDDWFCNLSHFAILDYRTEALFPSPSGGERNNFTRLW